MKIRNSRIIIFILLIEFTTGSVNASADPQGDIHPSDTKSVNSSSLGTTEIVSISNDGQAGNGYSSASSISADGRYIAFWSEAENLVNGDTNGTRDIFVQDLDTGQTTRVSIASDGSQANAGSGSYNTAISGDGRYVVFESHSTNLVPDDLNDRTDIFVHDRVTGQTTIVSTATDGTLGNSDSYFPSISADGNYIAFASNASNLVLDDTNDKMDVFVHDQLSGETTRISVASDDTQGDNISQTPSISADGRYVAFSSAASNFAPTEPFIFFIFVHDRVTGNTSLVSVNSEGITANSGAYGPSISGNGRYVAFTSGANNLVSGDTNEFDDVFIHDIQTGLTSRVSVASVGSQGNKNSGGSSVSYDGRYVSFGSQSNNLVNGDTNNSWDIFLFDMQLSQTELISQSTTGNIGNHGSLTPKISSDGQKISFVTISDNLVCGDTNDVRDIFVRDRSGIVELYSISGRITTPEMNPISNVVLSNGDGVQASSDENGDYLFEQLLPCSYLISPTLEDYLFTPNSIQISVPPSTDNKDFVGIRRIYSFLPSITRNYCGSSFADDFSNPNSGWPIDDDGYALYEYLEGEYRILAKQPNMVAAARRFSDNENFNAGVKVRIVNSIYGTYGLMFNIAEDWSHFYSFEIDPDGYFGIWRYSDTQGWDLLYVNFSPYIQTGIGVNQLEVKRDGDFIEVFANNHSLASIHDDSFIGKHYIGFIVTSYDQSYLDVRFDNYFINPGACSRQSSLAAPEISSSSIVNPDFMIRESSKKLQYFDTSLIQ